MRIFFSSNKAKLVKEIESKEFYTSYLPSAEDG
jgi:hypothetical protein